MKLFPEKKYTISLMNSFSSTRDELKQNTLAGSLVSEWTDKMFIGQVDENGFKLISSEIGRGAFCVFTGDFNGNNGTLEIKIHDAFKVLFSILILLPIIAVGLTIFQNGFEFFPGILLPTAMGILFVRFVFMELAFRFISKTGLNKLIKTINIVELKEII